MTYEDVTLMTPNDLVPAAQTGLPGLLINAHCGYRFRVLLRPDKQATVAIGSGSC